MLHFELVLIYILKLLLPIQINLMSESSTANFQEVIKALLNEDELFSLRERRNNSRKNFVRQVTVVLCEQPKNRLNGFTRDLSDGGIGLIHKFQVEPGSKALVTIHRLWDQPVVLKCETQWSTSNHQGWFQSGWRILSIESELN